MSWRNILRSNWKPDWPAIRSQLKSHCWVIGLAVGSLVIVPLGLHLGPILANSMGAEPWPVTRDLFIAIGALISIALLWVRVKATADPAKAALNSNRTELLNSAMEGLGKPLLAQRVAAVRILSDLGV